MATCDELRQQSQQLSGQIQALQSQYNAIDAQAKLDAATAVDNDTFGGTIPANPGDASEDQARIDYLTSLMPGQPQSVQAAISAVIGMWQTIINEIGQMNAIENQMTPLETQLSGVEWQMQQQGC